VSWDRILRVNPTVHLPDMAMTLSDFGRIDQLQNRIEESRAHYEEALNSCRSCPKVTTDMPAA
jgi:hypothetical protein